MKYLITILILIANVSYAQQKNYLEVKETLDLVSTNEPTFVCLEVVDQADATNKLAEVIAEYFAGLEYTSRYHIHLHGMPRYDKCRVYPMKDKGVSKYVEIYTEPDQYSLTEMIRIAVDDDKDADKKAKQIKDKWFLGKATKEKRKL